MPVTISAKGKDFESWRAAGNFAVMFREAMLNKTATLLSGPAAEYFQDVECRLEEQAATCSAEVAAMRQMVEKAAVSDNPADLKVGIVAFYAAAYGFFSRFQSVTAFWQLSAEFYRAMSHSVVTLAKEKMGMLARRLPPVALVALGPCGRNEFSPFCRMQVMMLHGEVDSSMIEPLRLFGRMLHESFEAIGLLLDDVVTPRNPDWCGTVSRWCEKMARGVERGNAKELIELLRLADQSALYQDADLWAGFRADCLELLGGSFSAMNNLVVRLNKIPGGIGLMGGVRLERSGAYRGLFRLLDHALLPLSVCITSLSLLKGIEEIGTPQRIRGLLAKGALDVETAERALEAWHLFNRLHLSAEAGLQPEWGRQTALYLDVLALSEADQGELRSCLEATAMLQRYVGIAYNRWEEQAAC